MCWTLLGVPFLSVRRASLEAVRVVELRLSLVQRNQEDRPTKWYTVSFGGERSLTLHASGRLLRARKFAERVARDLALPLRDSSTGRCQERQPEELDMNLGQRLRHRGVEPTLPDVPAGSHIRLREGTQKVIELPPQKVHPLLQMFAFGAPVALGCGAWVTTRLEVALLLLVPAAVMVAFFAWKIVAAARPKLVAVGPEGVEMRTLGSRSRIAFADLEEIVHCQSDLHLLADQTHLVVPYDFTDAAEALFVSGIIEHVAYHHRSADGPQVGARGARKTRGGGA